MLVNSSLVMKLRWYRQT